MLSPRCGSDTWRRGQYEKVSALLVSPFFLQSYSVEEDRLARVGRVNGVVEVVYWWSSTRGLESVGEKCRVSRYYCDNRFWLSFCCCPVCVLALAVLATLFCVICTINVDYTELFAYCRTVLGLRSC